MKRIVSLLLTLIIAAALCTLSSCGFKNTPTDDGAGRSDTAVVPTDPGDETGDTASYASEHEGENAREIFTYRDAYDMFKEVYSWGTHAEYCEYVSNEANKMKNEVVRVNNEIMTIMREKRALVNELMGWDLSQGDYYEKFILPYEKYYNSRMEAAEKVGDGFLAAASLVTLG